jgi:hypothetical protein
VAFRFGDFLTARTDAWDITPRGYFVSLADVVCVKAEVFDRRLVLRANDPGVEQRANPRQSFSS